MNPRSHSFRLSAFFLLNAMSISSRSCCVAGLKGSRCCFMSPKYFLASVAVLVPSPCQKSAPLLTGVQTHLEVLDLPAPSVEILVFPCLVLGDREEGDLLLGLGHLHACQRCLTRRGRPTLTIGVMNSSRKPGTLRSEGKKWSRKLMMSPLMCDPS